ncbi:rcc01693 family protein [Agrobacterium tumefaciens]|uniref:rcc01693 family protein n=1 Tax=Agrobacterium tumefaciens TaxID=358 RepID=UPI00287BDA76|nr:rcc01693 family protein [Agrobacterium tumefaciens]MDS7596548.1 phage tail assembly chaperone [Agrobacterium tumefaciens]
MNAAAGATNGTPVHPFPWDEAMHIALCLLRLPAPMFWALTPLEFFAMTGGRRLTSGALGRAAMEALIQRFPDV